MKTIGQLIKPSQQPKSNDLAKPSSSSIALREKMVQRYGSSLELVDKVTPARQLWCAENVESCFFGDFPTLSQLKALGGNTPVMWLVPQLANLSEFCGARDKLSVDQLRDLASIITTEFYYLKITELMLFFHRFKAGKYGRFYGSVDPLIIVEALHKFRKERGDIIDRHDREEAQRLREQAAAEAVTWEEYREKYAVTNETKPFER